MPNVLLKNEIGEDVEYENVDTVTLRKVDGGTATYTYGLPEPTENWRMIHNYREAVSSNPGAPLRSLYSVYSCQVANGFLVSSSLTNFGLWLESSYDAIKLDDRNFTNMYPVTDGAVLLTGNSIYYYETLSRTLTLIDDRCGSYEKPIAIGDKYFIGGSIRWLIFNPGTKETVCILDGNGKTTSMQPTSCDIGDSWLFSFINYNTTYPAFRGIYRLDKDTLEFEQIFFEGYRWMNTYRSTGALNSSGIGTPTGGGCIMDMGDGTILISSATTSNNSGGFLRYDRDTGTVTRITTEAYYWAYYSYPYYAYSIGYRECSTHIIHGHGVCLTPNSGSSSTVGGMWWYDFSTKEFTRITTRGRYYYWYESDDVAIGTYSSYGCSVYDKTTRQWFTPSNSGTCYCAAVSEDGIILGGDSSTTGLKYFDFETGQLTMVNASGPWYYACKVPEGFLVSSGTSSKLGVWLFNTSDKSFIQVWDKGYAWVMKRWNDTVVLGSYQTSLDYNGILLYKDGQMSLIQSTNATRMCYMERVDDGILVSRDTVSYCYFVDGTTGAIKQLSNDNGYFGQYWYSWYGPGDYNKPTYEFNRKFGNYRVISGYSSDGGCIFDDTTHELVKIYNWAKTSDTPSTTYTTRLSLNRPRFFELDNSWILIIGASGYPVMFNYETGMAYRFNSDSFYLGDSIDHPYSPYIVQIPTDGGFLLFSKRFDYSIQEGSVLGTSNDGILFVDTILHKATKVFTSGYYDTHEETPGGLYIYLGGMEYAQKLYWDAANRTMTQIITET